ncbi:MAG: ATP-binding cassette domain-containing protein, partial [Acidimicrobiales bacterium]|nr:ATP-binding cassette domain-containing protein [Acidimicrobiales bacterium]
MPRRSLSSRCESGWSEAATTRSTPKHPGRIPASIAHCSPAICSAKARRAATLSRNSDSRNGTWVWFFTGNTLSLGFPMDQSTTPPPAVEVDGLAKRYGDFEAVRGIDFTVGTGETFGFLGPNGAGKSTTIKMLTTLAEPTGGAARVVGFDVARERAQVRRNIGL